MTILLEYAPVWGIPPEYFALTQFLVFGALVALLLSIFWAIGYAMGRKSRIK